jgi:hypothetical protein
MQHRTGRLLILGCSLTAVGCGSYQSRPLLESEIYRELEAIRLEALMPAAGGGKIAVLARAGCIGWDLRGRGRSGCAFPQPGAPCFPAGAGSGRRGAHRGRTAPESRAPGHLAQDRALHEEPGHERLSTSLSIGRRLGPASSARRRPELRPGSKRSGLRSRTKSGSWLRR